MTHDRGKLGSQQAPEKRGTWDIIWRQRKLMRIAAPSITMKAEKPTLKQVQAVRCPTCGAGPGEKCELTTGQPRTEPHRDRKLSAADAVKMKLSKRHNGQ
jgi:hypothetical protein